MNKKAENILRLRSRQNGMTLLEIVFSLSIITTAILATLLAVTSAHKQNQLNAMTITARNAINAQIEEIMTVAADNVTESREAATALIAYYADAAFDGNQVAGPGGASQPKVTLAGGILTWRFPIADLGESLLDSTSGGIKSVEASDRAIGIMNIYLDERTVDPAKGEAYMWQNLGTNTEVQYSGFDMDGNGSILPPVTPITMTLLRTEPEKLRIARVPIDIEVVFYTSADQNIVAYNTVRRIVAGNSNGIANLMNGMGIK